MATSEALMQTFFGTVPHCLSSTTYLSKLDLSAFPKSRRICVLKRGLRCAQAVKFTNMQKVKMGFGYLRGRRCLYGTAMRGGQCKSVVFCVEPAESVKGSADVDVNGTWYLDNGASNHVSGDKRYFSYIDDSVTGKVRFDDDSRIDIKGNGTI